MNNRALFSYYIKHTLKIDIVTAITYTIAALIAHYVFKFDTSRSQLSVIMLFGLVLASFPNALLTFPLTRQYLLKLIVQTKLLSSILLTVSLITLDLLTGILRLIHSKELPIILLSSILYIILFHIIGLLGMCIQKITFSFTKMLLLVIWAVLGLGIVFFTISPPITFPFHTILFIGIPLFVLYSVLSYCYFYYAMTHTDFKI